MHQKWQPLIPDSYTTPREYKVKEFIFLPLGVKDIDPDYEAVMSGIKRLKGMFDFFPDWPSPAMTKDEDLSNLGWHQTEFSMNTSFAYKIVTEKNNDYVGCAYIFPSNDNDFEVDCYLWVKNEFEANDQELFELFKLWLKTSWPFKHIRYPGRT